MVEDTWRDSWDHKDLFVATSHKSPNSVSLSYPPFFGGQKKKGQEGGRDCWPLERVWIHFPFHIWSPNMGLLLSGFANLDVIRHHHHLLASCRPTLNFKLSIFFSSKSEAGEGCVRRWTWDARSSSKSEPPPPRERDNGLWVPVSPLSLSRAEVGVWWLTRVSFYVRYSVKKKIMWTQGRPNNKNDYYYYMLEIINITLIVRLHHCLQ